MVILHDKKIIENFLRRNTALNIYQIGDLDDFFYPYTIWYALKQEEEIKAIALLYTAVNPPVLLALSPAEEIESLKQLLTEMIPLLPVKFYSHLTPGIEPALESNYSIEFHGDYCKMLLTKNKDVNDIFLKTYQLTYYDLPKIRQLYQDSYPDNSFDPRMLETGMFYGIDEGNRLVSIAGIHVFSEKYKAAALGNITTLPEFRGKGLAKLVTSRVCKELKPHADIIGLNVHSENVSAIKCYEDLGFEIIAPYREYMITRK
jgi:ribosomal protein S18 acetylase RimI-like enzyme